VMKMVMVTMVVMEMITMAMVVMMRLRVVCDADIEKTMVTLEGWWTDARARVCGEKSRR